MFDPDLVSAIEQLGSPVGLALSDEAPNARDGLALPSCAKVWNSYHAMLVVCPIPSPSIDFALLGSACVRWLADVLDEWRQRKGRLIDGYLILALGERPENELRIQSKRFELNTKVCRKHVIWPDDEGDWRHRLAQVTVLGLPAAGEVVTPSSEVVVPENAQRCLDWYELPGASIKRVFSQVEEMVNSEASSEVQIAG